MIIMQISATLLLPLLALKLENSIKVFKWLGAVIICYFLGFIMSYGPSTFVAEKISLKIAEVSVLLAIPMLLFATDFRKWLKNAKTTFIAFAFGISSVLIIAYVVGWQFSNSLQDADKVAAMLVGVYTGGTPNVASLYLALDISEKSYLQVNAADILVGGSYFIFLIAAGAKIIQSKFPPYKRDSVPTTKQTNENNVRWVYGIYGFLLSVALLGLSTGVSYILRGKIVEVIVIFTLSTLAICASFFPEIRKWKASFLLGDYCILIFCVAIGSATKFEAITQNTAILYFSIAIMLGAIFLHTMLCYFFRIDGDTFLITSTACIFGPAFIAPMARVLKNESLILPGITTGVIGLALGNYLGLTIYYLLQ